MYLWRAHANNQKYILFKHTHTTLDWKQKKKSAGVFCVIRVAVVVGTRALLQIDDRLLLPHVKNTSRYALLLFKLDSFYVFVIENNECV